MAERVAPAGVRGFGDETTREAHDGDSQDAHARDPESRGRRNRPWEHTFINSVFKFCDQLLTNLASQRQALVLTADPRDRPVHEHQREILGVLGAESIEAQDDAPEVLHGWKAVKRPGAIVAEETNALSASAKKMSPFDGK